MEEINNQDVDVHPEKNSFVDNAKKIAWEQDPDDSIVFFEYHGEIFFNP